MNLIQDDDSELHTILAALRFYQAGVQLDLRSRRPAIHDIATNGGAVVAVDADAIDQLCQRLNLDEALNASRFSKAEPGLGARLRRIDWRLLAQQKLWLLGQAMEITEARGLIELLDALQDAAVDDLGIPESQVFPM